MLKVFIEILNANLQLVLKSLFKAYHKLLVKYQFLGATLYMFLNIMYLIVWKLESIGEKGKVWFNHMFLLVLKLLALLNNQLYFIILSQQILQHFFSEKLLFLRLCLRMAIESMDNGDYLLKFLPARNII